MMGILAILFLGALGLLVIAAITKAIVIFFGPPEDL